MHNHLRELLTDPKSALPKTLESQLLSFSDWLPSYGLPELSYKKYASFVVNKLFLIINKEVIQIAKLLMTLS